MSTSQRRSAGRAGSKTKKSASARPKSEQSKPQAHVCRAAGCGKVCRSATGLKSHQRQVHSAPLVVETPTQAVERALRSVTVTPQLAVLAATCRELAKALEACDATDKAKTAKELKATIAELLGPGTSTPQGPDWTEGADG